MKRYFIGIDISKEWLDIAVWDKQSSTIIDQKKVDNKGNKITKMSLGLIKKFGKDSLWFCFEHTGNYGLALTCSLESLEVDYSAVPALEIQKSQGIKRGKNDQVDARRIAEFAAVQSHKLEFSHLPAQIFLQVKQLLTYRNQLVKSRSSFKNSLQAHKLSEKTTHLKIVTKDIQKRIKNLDKDVKVVEVNIEKLLKDNKEINKNMTLVKSVKGIGPIIAATIIVCTQNFTSFDDPRKFNCYTGLAPFEHSSGLSKGSSRTSKFRNKNMKTLMMNAANSAAIYDPQLKNYYNRKVDEGKENYTVLNAVACKLIYRVFATVKRQSPYIILQH